MWLKTGAEGLEPSTFRLTGECSDQLGEAPVNIQGSYFEEPSSLWHGSRTHEMQLAGAS